MTTQVGQGGPHPAKEALALHQDENIGLTGKNDFDNTSYSTQIALR